MYWWYNNWQVYGNMRKQILLRVFLHIINYQLLLDKCVNLLFSPTGSTYTYSVVLQGTLQLRSRKRIELACETVNAINFVAILQLKCKKHGECNTTMYNFSNWYSETTTTCDIHRFDIQSYE